MAQLEAQQPAARPGHHGYAELHAISNFSFLRGASRPEELVEQAARLGYRAIAITDECSLAGVVKAHVAARHYGIKLLIGSEFRLQENIHLLLIAPDRRAYGELSSLITLARRRSPKGEYQLQLSDLRLTGSGCLAIWLPGELLDKPSNAPPENSAATSLQQHGDELAALFPQRLWIGYSNLLSAGRQQHYLHHYSLATALNLPMVACGDVHMHCRQRKPLQDLLTAIRLNSTVQQLGRQLQANSERYLRPVNELQQLYPPALLAETVTISQRCRFSLDELRYEYPRELVPPRQKPHKYLRALTLSGAEQRWPDGIPAEVEKQIERELQLIRELEYEYYFLTVYDIVQFARGRGILCQGRGSAANSVVCYCLFITEVSPTRVSLLFERFISKERDEPPDIDVDFEHERREEVIQYIYKKYSRERAALAATVITYRTRSAVRDVGKALGLSPLLVDQLARSLAWWDRQGDLHKRFAEYRLPNHQQLAGQFLQLVKQIKGFPRHLSQHVGGFIITAGPVSQLVPVENASMAERTVVQWDKEDIEALGLLKVDVLALGMLSAIRKSIEMIQRYQPALTSLQAIPEADSATYDMLCRGDSIGVFQVESRAQMSMLPRLRPRCYYDLVIEVAIVRPGPIQGRMVHPYLKRRENPAAVHYPSPAIREVLQSTLGVPIFQEQVIKLAMVAAGFSGGEADQLRRAMASWGRNGNLLKFRTKLIDGMLERGYSQDFAERLFEQIKGFGGYGFPESHSASFALLVYVSAWIKCHHPAAFYCGLLNSQPMGFYTPSQLVQDARRHQITVLPVNVNQSDWDHRLELPPGDAGRLNIGPGRQPPLRLGMRLVKGLGRESAERISRLGRETPFTSATDLARRAQLNKKELAALADANALKDFSPHRYQAHWQVMAIEPDRPLLTTADEPQTEPLTLSAPQPMEETLADYRSLGLTLGHHPMLLIRNHPELRGCKRQIDLERTDNNRFVRVAGLVTGRQRPGSASGVIFVTLEDETGNINVVVWKNLQERCRQPLLTGKLLLIKGVMERKNEVIHVIAGDILDRSWLLDELALKSRDFH
ncbi:MAG TPA: error-prone DNA polymerase [Gammaproteobacteria bacterium]|nr:error-prone DNA polymerase [Gammaproteobacteria bacterium]